MLVRLSGGWRLGGGLLKALKQGQQVVSLKVPASRVHVGPKEEFKGENVASRPVLLLDVRCSWCGKLFGDVTFIVIREVLQVVTDWL